MTGNRRTYVAMKGSIAVFWQQASLFNIVSLEDIRIYFVWIVMPFFLLLLEYCIFKKSIVLKLRFSLRMIIYLFLCFLQ